MHIKELCRKHGFSEPSYYAWKAKFGGMKVSDAQRLKALEAENTKLKKLLANSMLEVARSMPCARCSRESDGRGVSARRSRLDDDQVDQVVARSGCQQCGSSSSMRLAAWVGRRSSTSRRYA
jgi:putative transposase